MALGLKVPEPRQSIVQPGETENQLVQGYLRQSQDVQDRVQPIQQKMDQVSEEMSQITPPQPPNLQPVPQYQPKQLDANEMMNFAGLAMGLATLASKAVGGDVALALNSAGAAMKGFSEGNLAQTKQDIAQFNTKMQSVVAQNTAQLQAYDRVMQDRKLTLNQKMQELTVLGHKFQDEIAIASLRQGDIKFLLQRQDKLKLANDQLELKRIQINGQFEARHEHEQTIRELAKLRLLSSEHGRGTSLTPEAIDNAASFYILNGRMPIGMARIGQSAIEAIQNRAAEMTQKAGMTPEEFAAAGPITRQKLGALLQFEKQRNAIQAYESMLDLNVGILKDLSAKVNRSDSPYFNKPIIWLQQNAQGDPDVSEYLFQVNTVSTEIARVLNNPNLTGQLTDTARDELMGVVSGNLNAEQMDRVLSRAQNDAKNRAKSMDVQSQKIIDEVKNPLGKGRSSGPSVGDKRIINGTPAHWDGKGWLAD